MRYVELAAATLGIVVLLAMPAAAKIYDFEDLPAGHTLVPGDFGPEIEFSVSTNRPDGSAFAVVVDSSCPQGCSGGVRNLETPSDGPGNTVAQGHILVIYGDGSNPGGGGGHHDHDGDSDSDLNSRPYHLAQRPEGTLELVFQRPHKLYSLRIIGIDRNEAGSRIELDLVDGSVVVLPLAQLGKDSAQTLTVTNPGPATALRIIIKGSAAVDDIDIEPACGDGWPDTGEACDPPDGKNCGHDCMIVSTCATVANRSTNEGSSCANDNYLCSFTDTCTKGICISEPRCIPECERCDAGTCSSLCGNPHQTELDDITISDALFNLLATVGSATCALCICDVNNDGNINTTDTLITLRSVVKLPQVFDCSPPATTPQP